LRCRCGVNHRFWLRFRLWFGFGFGLWCRYGINHRLWLRFWFGFWLFTDDGGRVDAQ
jgi:hypothetical protein